MHHKKIRGTISLSYIAVTLILIAACARQSLPAVDEVHSHAIVIDTHTDTPMKMADAGFNPAVRHEPPDSRVDYPRLREGEVDAIFFALFTGQQERIPENYQHAYDLANRMLDSVVLSAESHPDMVQLAYSADDILRIAHQNRTAICIGMENGFPLAEDITRVKEFYDKGVRYITLSHSSNNDICDSSTDRTGEEHQGLSSFGKEVVEEMNRLGMIVDVSHISDKSFFDVIALSKAPVIASHSSVRAVCDHPRNMSDEMIRALAENGGVIQICILGDYIASPDTTSENYRRMEALRTRYNNWQFNDENERMAAQRAYDSINRYYPAQMPTVAQAVDHIDHVADLVGVDYVGIGSDFDGGGGLADCEDVSDFPAITAELLRRGYSEEDIDKIWGGNFLRVFRAVEEASEKFGNQ